jgi:hypothetical protein
LCTVTAPEEPIDLWPGGELRDRRLAPARYPGHRDREPKIATPRTDSPGIGIGLGPIANLTETMQIEHDGGGATAHALDARRLITARADDRRPP